MEGIAEKANLETLSSHILTQYPNVDLQRIKSLRNQYWNATKHYYQRDNRTARDDDELMASFSDKANDAVLFMGWLDYMQVTGILPVEVQVFQVWWYATNPDKMDPNVDPTPYQSLFPEIPNKSRAEQKRLLRYVSEKYRLDVRLLADPRTERGPLSPSNREAS